MTSLALNPLMLRIYEAECRGIINIPSLNNIIKEIVHLCTIPLPLFFDSTSDDLSPHSVAWSNDGSKMFIVGSENDSIYRYNVPTPFDISSITEVAEQTMSVAADISFPPGITFNGDGSKIYVTGNTIPGVVEYTLGGNFDISAPPNKTAILDFGVIGASNNDPLGLTWNADGSKLFVVDSFGFVSEFPVVATNYDLADITTETILKQIFVGQVGENTPHGIAFSPTGDKMFVSGTGNTPRLSQYSLSIPFDLTSTLTFVRFLDVTVLSVNPRGIKFNDDGLRLYFIGGFAPDVGVHQIFLEVPYVLP